MCLAGHLYVRNAVDLLDLNSRVKLCLARNLCVRNAVDLLDSNSKVKLWLAGHLCVFNAVEILDSNSKVAVVVALVVVEQILGPFPAKRWPTTVSVHLNCTASMIATS